MNNKFSFNIGSVSTKRRILITGGAGFIGSELVRQLVKETDFIVINIDKLTYAGNLNSLDQVSGNTRYFFERVDICDAKALQNLFCKYRPSWVMHLAAESHVDRSIEGPTDFIQTNIYGTFIMLQASKNYWENLDQASKDNFRFLHVSTDEVFGSLGESGLFTENTPYTPRSPYSASKASSDHLAQSWHHTYSLPVIISNCSNNYGPYQFPEKLIPHIIIKALNGEKLPVYGNGNNVRDWLFVSDHVSALRTIIKNGKIGETYNIGGESQKKNIEVVQLICDILDDLLPNKKFGSYHSLIEFVKDRPGHDFRYAMDITKIKNKLGWKPTETFESGLKKTIIWYLENKHWWQQILDGKYKTDRLGLL